MGGGGSWVSDASYLVGQLAALVTAIAALYRLIKGRKGGGGNGTGGTGTGGGAAGGGGAAAA